MEDAITAEADEEEATTGDADFSLVAGSGRCEGGKHRRIPRRLKSPKEAMRVSTAGEATVKEKRDSSSRVTFRRMRSPLKRRESTEARSSLDTGTGDWITRAVVRQP